jgi:multidrug efflux pump subunit AcrB
MGMLVDNSIVVVDGMLVDLQRGLERRRAYTRFAKKTALPLLGATVIAIAAFFPIFLSPDVTGEYTADLFVVLAISLTLSWILALTQVPVFAAGVFRRYKPQQNKEAHSHFIHRYFRGLVRVAMRHRLITLLLVVILMGSTIWGYQFVRNSFFPDLPYNQIYMVYELPAGSDTDRVVSDLEEVESYLETIPEVTAVTRSVGATPARYILLRTMAEPRMGYGELIITLSDFAAVQKWAPVIQAEVSKRHPDAYVRVKRYNFVVETTHPVEVMYTGPDTDVLRSLAEKTERIIAAEPTARLVKSDWFPRELKLQVDYNQAAGRRGEISRPAVSNAMLMATEGMPIGVYYDGLEDYPIMVHMVDSQGEPVSDLRGIPVWGMTPRGDLSVTLLQQVMRGAASMAEIIRMTMGSIPLSQVADSIHLEWEEKLIRRHNGKRSIMIKSEVSPGSLPEEVLTAVRQEVESIQLPPGYSRQWRGEYMTKNESLKYLSLNLPLALFIMATVLILLFRNIRNPLIIFLCLPLAAIGIVWGLVFSGRELGFVAIVGAIGLMGMMIKNGVVLIDDIEDRINNGDNRFASVVESAVARMRPVMMASMTTILGMIPLLWDAMFASLAVTIMSGLLVGTLITLVIMPVLYSLFFGVEIPRKGIATESRNNE